MMWWLWLIVAVMVGVVGGAFGWLLRDEQERLGDDAARARLAANIALRRKEREQGAGDEPV